MFWDQQILDQSYIKKPQIGQLANMLDLNGQILYSDQMVARLYTGAEACPFNTVLLLKTAGSGSGCFLVGKS